MTRSDPTHCRAENTLNRVAQLLDEQLMARRIDESIDRARDEFERVGDGYSHRRFIEATARFVQHVYGEALPCVRRLTPSQARDEAVGLLTRAYEGTYADGYHGAVLDASDPSGPGIELALAGIAETIKAQQRQMYVRWVQVRHVDSADWPTKCAMASILLEWCGESLPPELRDCAPEQLAEDVFDLLALHTATSSQFRPVLTGPTGR